VNNEINL